MIKAVYDISAHFTHGEKPDALIVNGVDFEPVRHGRNLESEYPSLFTCSECDWSCWDTYCGDGDYKYCPHCGAKMDKE